MPLPTNLSINDFMVIDLITQRRRQMNPRDRWVGFSGALLFHVVLLLVGGMVLIKPAEFGVDVGLSSLDVQLVDAPQESVVQPVEQLPQPIENSDAIQTPVVPKPEPKVQVPVLSSQGAQADVKPAYLKNPAPHYPMEARRNKWEGTVVLEAMVGVDGMVKNVTVKESSGHSILDDAALKTVRTWQFHPALLGSMKIESSVLVPVRFDLKK
jgi:TonB family protein